MPPSRRPHASTRPSGRATPRGRERASLYLVMVATLIGLAVIALAGRGSDDGATPAALAAGTPSSTATVTSPPSAATAAGESVETEPATTEPPTSEGATTEATEPLPDLDADPLQPEEGCIIDDTSVRLGSSGPSVSCVQRALADAGLYDGAVNGEFDNATHAAVRRLQEERDLFVDGVVGRETALSLEVWPDEESFVVRTPPPPPGAKDSWGFELSSVATAGADTPPLPENSGSGKRLVYERRGQRVWAVDGDGNVIRSWLVSGSMYSNELPGTHKVYSKSEQSTAWNGKAILPMMVRWYQTEIGHIGFHGIPTKVSDGSPYQTDAELGTRLSGGCQRQNNFDAAFVWAFADIGTTVVVI